MMLNQDTIKNLSDSYTFVVDSDGTCVLHPRRPDLVGSRPWEWCVEEDQAACRETFVQACMFRKEQHDVRLRMLFQGRSLKLSLTLYPLESSAGKTGQVLCLFRVIFEGDLTQRERHVLALLAGGADAPQVAEVLDITASTARDHIANIKRKLNIHHPEGFRLAAHHFDISGAAKAVEDNVD